MESGAQRLCAVAIALLVLGACATKPPATKPVETTVQTVELTPQPIPDVTPVPDEKPTGDFVASEELYKKTFAEVQDVVAALTRIISQADYDQWLTYLTADYINQTGTAANLVQVSSAGVLKKDGIVLKSLKDYFQNVVVRSHLQATLDDIQFVDATHVKAITRIQGASIILYYLVREDGRWKIGIQQADQK
jgi:hypothetical protein